MTGEIWRKVLLLARCRLTSSKNNGRKESWVRKHIESIVTDCGRGESPNEVSNDRKRGSDESCGRDQEGGGSRGPFGKKEIS